MPLYGPAPTEVAVVSPGEAAGLRAAGALLVDARPLRKRLGRGVGAELSLDWRVTCRGRGREGRLPRDRAELAVSLRRAGIAANRSVLLVDAGPEGWGEGARIAWTLAQLGHPSVAWMAGAAPRIRRAAPVPAPDPRVVSASDRHSVATLDVRSPREFAGATPFGEARGGHLPGARSLPFAELWTTSGETLAPKELHRKLDAIGIPERARIRCVCTGGVRSAAATLMLRAAGRAAENDDGGMWLHAADPSVALEQ